MNLKRQLKNRIEKLEYLQNSAGRRLNRISVKATNLKICKRINTVFADITVLENGNRHRYPDCEYDLEILTKDKK